jgi:hypothetical protein
MHAHTQNLYIYWILLQFLVSYCFLLYQTHFFTATPSPWKETPWAAEMTVSEALLSHSPPALSGLCHPVWMKYLFLVTVITFNSWVDRMAGQLKGNLHNSNRSIHWISFCGLGILRKGSEYFSEYPPKQNNVTHYHDLHQLPFSKWTCKITVPVL